MKDFIEENKRKYEKYSESVKEDFTSISLKHTRLLLYIMTIGHVIAFVILNLELLWKRLKTSLPKLWRKHPPQI